MGRFVPTRQLWPRLLLLIAVLLPPRSCGLSLMQKALLLEPSLYILRFNIKSNMSRLHFTYYLHNEVHFNLKQATDKIVMETRANFVYQPILVINHSILVEVDDMQMDDFYYVQKTDGTMFKPGHYTLFTTVLGQIREDTLGIKYILHKDRKTKKWTYSILLDFQPNFAKYVMVVLRDVSTPCEIQLLVINEVGFHAYFIKQPVSQTIVEAPIVPEIEILDFYRKEQQNSSDVLPPHHYASNSTMYSMIMPISFVVLYISENVRQTMGSLNFSATVTAERNQIGQFSKDFEYVLKLFYKYAKKYATFGPRKLKLKLTDVFLHLRQNVSEIGDTTHTHCTVSILFVLQSHRSLATLNSFMSRCMAAYHLMTRRFPKYWDNYYILMGLREYYAIFMRLDGGGVVKHNDFMGIGPQQIRSFEYDDTETDQPTLGEYYSNGEVYWYMNIMRALSVMNMIKHLIVGEKGEVFDRIVGEFLAHDKVVFDRKDFTSAYQNLTQQKVFRSQKTIDQFFDSWTFQFGYPIVYVQRIGPLVRFTQSVCPVSKNTDPGQLFIIPINLIPETKSYYEVNKTEPTMWMVPPAKELIVELSGLAKWLVINNQRASYFRVRYDEWNYKLLRYELLRGDLKKIAPVTRGQILDDVLFFVKIGERVLYDTALEMVEYLKRETDELVWEIVDFELKHLTHLLRFTPAYKKFQLFMLINSRKFYKAKVEQASRPSKYAIEWACFAGLEECHRYTYEAFKTILTRRESFEHLYEMICWGVKSSDRATFRYIKLALLNRLESMDTEIFFKALSCLDNYKQLKESLNMIFRRTSAISVKMTRADKLRVVTGMCENSAEGCQAVLDFTFWHPKLVYRGLGGSMFKTLLSYLTKSIYKRDQQRRLRLIIMYLKIPDTELIWQGMQSKRLWLKDNLTVVIRWLTSYLRDIKQDDFNGECE